MEEHPPETGRTEAERQKPSPSWVFTGVALMPHLIEDFKDSAGERWFYRVAVT
jgi:hypothetical protein